MVVLGAVCVTALVVIPALWWSRGMHPGAPGAVPDWRTQEMLSFARGRGVEFRESTIGVLDPIIPTAV
jgi:hypothetical protein